MGSHRELLDTHSSCSRLSEGVMAAMVPSKKAVDVHTYTTRFRMSDHRAPRQCSFKCQYTGDIAMLLAVNLPPDPSPSRLFPPRSPGVDRKASEPRDNHPAAPLDRSYPMWSLDKHEPNHEPNSSASEVISKQQAPVATGPLASSRAGSLPSRSGPRLCRWRARGRRRRGRWGANGAAEGEEVSESTGWRRGWRRGWRC